MMNLLQMNKIMKKTAKELVIKDIEKQEDIEDSKESFENTSISEDKNIDNAKKIFQLIMIKLINEEIEKKRKFEEETLDAMDSVREAVVKSKKMKKIIWEKV